MSDRERLRQLVDLLPETDIQHAISLPEQLEDSEPLTPTESANIESGLDDIRHGRMVMLEEYDRDRGL